ncbi:DNA-directed RNA polymerase subunit delta [Lysinibacillus contaminans]|uniref:Probable DNA-directed RNA polymerase subunit delta n=1 Tax=Lysinibacillus contaminans TaxID=1293441 RepID=A0ABR5JX70_9BACI|nr:DNA-directed RNA polymerase subunit delta [Lysinibacillus contaminans]
MHELNFREMTKEQLAEESLIDLTHAILEEKRTSIPLNDLLTILKELTGLKDAEIKRRLLQFYTDLNIDGRFLYNQENGWGLREWFKVEQIEEETAPSVKTHKKKAKSVVGDDDDDLDLDEEEIDFDEDYEEFVEEELDEEKVDIDFDDEEEIEEIEVIEEIEEIEVIDEDFIEEEFEVEDELEEEI